MRHINDRYVNTTQFWAFFFSLLCPLTGRDHIGALTTDFEMPVNHRNFLLHQRLNGGTLGLMRA